MSLRIKQKIRDRDTTELEINNADDGVFLLAFLKPDATGDSTDNYYITGNITAGGSASSIWSSIRDYYRSVTGTDPEVTLTKCRNYFDSEIDCSSTTDAIRDYVYSIVVPRSISRPSATAVMVVPTETTA